MTHFYINPNTNRKIQIDKKTFNELKKMPKKDNCLYDKNSVKRCIKNIQKYYPGVFLDATKITTDNLTEYITKESHVLDSINHNYRHTNSNNHTKNSHNHTTNNYYLMNESTSEEEPSQELKQELKQEQTQKPVQEPTQEPVQVLTQEFTQEPTQEPVEILKPVVNNENDIFPVKLDNPLGESFISTTLNLENDKHEIANFINNDLIPLNFPEVQENISGLIKNENANNIIGIVHPDNTLSLLPESIPIDKTVNLDSVPILTMPENINIENIIDKKSTVKNILSNPNTCPYNYTWDDEYKKCKIILKDDISYILLNKENDHIIGYF
jgi:hypothetical protein